MLKVGFAHADITPALDSPSSIGSFRQRKMTGVHDPLLASACVIDDGNCPLALIGIDAAVIERTTADAARRAIATQTGIPANHVIISASHTHQGGPTITTFNATADPAYAAHIAQAIASAVTDAWQHRADARAAHGFGRVNGIHFNRRFLMRDGREVTHPGK